MDVRLNPLRSKKLQLLRKRVQPIPDVQALISEITRDKQAIFEENEEIYRLEQSVHTESLQQNVNQPAESIISTESKKKSNEPALRSTKYTKSTKPTKFTKKAPARMSMGKSRMSIDDEPSTSRVEQPKKTTTLKSSRNITRLSQLKKKTNESSTSNAKQSNNRKRSITLSSHHSSNRDLNNRQSIPMNSRISTNRNNFASFDSQFDQDFAFYNEAMQMLTVLDDQQFDSSEVAQLYEDKKYNINHSLRTLSKEFNGDLEFARSRHLRYWFILEQPFHGCVDTTFTQGRSLVSRLPVNFRISYLSDLLRMCKLESSGITHVVLNITSNWVTEFDVSDQNAKEIYKTLIGDLVVIFQEHGIKKIVIMTFPFSETYAYSAGRPHLIVHQAIIDSNKKVGNILAYVDYSFILQSNNLVHGNEGFQSALKHINDNHFK